MKTASRSIGSTLIPGGELPEQYSGRSSTSHGNHTSVGFEQTITQISTHSRHID